MDDIDPASLFGRWLSYAKAYGDRRFHIEGITAMKPDNSAAPTVVVSVGWKSWWMVGVLFFLYMLSILDRIVITMLVTPIKQDLLLSDFQMSVILGPAFAIFYALFGLPLGWAADRYPRRWVVFLGVTLWSLMTMMSGLARSFGALLVARIGVGVGEAALGPSAYSLLADEFPRERLTTAISVYQMAAKFGTAAAFAVGGIAIAFATHLVAMDIPFVRDAKPWQLVFLMLGLPGLLAGLLAFTFSDPVGGHGEFHQDAERNRLVGDRNLAIDDAQRHFGQAEHGVVGHDADVAAHGEQQQARAQAMSLDRADYRLGQLTAAKDAHLVLRRFAPGALPFLIILGIASGAKGTARAAKNGDACFIVLGVAVERFSKVVRHLLAPSVEPFGPIHGYRDDRTIFLIFHPLHSG